LGFVAEIKRSPRSTSTALLDDLRGRVAAEAAFRGLRVHVALVSRQGFHRRRRPAADESLVDVSALHWV